MQSRSITSSYLGRYRHVAEQAPDTEALLPLTGAQRRFVLARRMRPTGRPDLVPLFFSFPAGAVDVARLHAAACHLAALHPALRSRVEVRRGVPVQRLAAAEGLVRRLPVPPGRTAEDALRRALAGWSPDGPPLRLFLAADGGPAGPRELLALVLDHTVCDERSLGRITADLSLAYGEGLGPQDVPAPRAAGEAAAYGEAVRLQLAAEERASAPGSLAYWAGRLSALRPPPAPAGEPDAAGTGSAERRLPLPEGGARAVAFPAALDACAEAARAVYGEAYVPALGYPWGGRPAGAGPVLGCFLNTVAHPADGAGREARTAAWWDDLDHADAPFDEVVHAARAAGVPWAGRLDGLLTFEDLDRRPPLRLGDATGHETHLDGRPLPGPFAVTVSYGRDLLVRMDWQRTALPGDRAERAFARLVATLSGSAGVRPDRP
ncbi:non-ribosomal peptide synthetase [Streptomyces caatingaensis]|uniref:Non-ribosomal peptide synthetase n=1 Tax=Streptomyces caatingaensis TaxID=1678637 RepID=A0A0K9XBN2_9ACTN|nr:non-ribosomal peptide synthetase [Streptomyces caatingaensis]KNB50618.1 non-ribosomal peptide synthetase [Streptomyces caatingaensis]